MNAAGSPPSLRPLGVGEVLDRAVNLCVKHFAVLATIFVVYAVPFAIAQFFAGRDLTSILTNFQATLAASTASGKPADPKIFQHVLTVLPKAGAWYPALLLAAFVFAPLPAAALIEACSAFYLGRVATFEGAYRAALAAWPRLIVLNLIYLGMGLALYLAFFVVVFALAFAIVLVTVAAKVVGIVVAVVLVTALIFASLGFAIVATLAWQISYFTCVVEGTSPLASVRLGLRRVFVGVGLRRSLLVGVAYFAIAFVIGIITLVGESTIVTLVRSAFVGNVYGTIVQVATAAFTTAFIAIFYFDLRVREEGLDLQLEAAGARAQVVPQA